MARYWFKRKRFGYGAVPTTWQGWAVGVVYVVVMVVAGILLVPFGTEVSTAAVAAWAVIAVAATAAVIVTAYRKTEGSWRWQWSSRREQMREET